MNYLNRTTIIRVKHLGKQKLKVTYANTPKRNHRLSCIKGRKGQRALLKQLVIDSRCSRKLCFITVRKYGLGSIQLISGTHQLHPGVIISLWAVLQPSEPLSCSPVWAMRGVSRWSDSKWSEAPESKRSDLKRP